jgi:hypothetical protein
MISKKIITNHGRVSQESIIFSDLEELIGGESDESTGDANELQINSWREALLISDPTKRNAASSMEPFTAKSSADRVGVASSPKSDVRIKPESSKKSVMNRVNAPKKIKHKSPYHIYSFKCVNSAFRINLWIYVAIQLVIAAYLGNVLAGTFGFPGMMWILTIFFLKIAIDLSIVASHFGKHQDKLLAPALISTAIFAFPAVLLLIMNEVVRYIEF